MQDSHTKVSHILYASNEQLETKRQNLVIAPKGKKKNREILAHYSNKTYTRVYAGNCKMLMEELKEGTESTDCKTHTVQVRFPPTLTEMLL